MKDQDTELTGSVDQGGRYWTGEYGVRARTQPWETALNETVTAYAALVMTDGLTGWKYAIERQQVLACMFRLAAFATGESAETDRAVITAAVKRLIARDVSLPLTAEEFTELGVEE